MFGGAGEWSCEVITRLVEGRWEKVTILREERSGSAWDKILDKVVYRFENYPHTYNVSDYRKGITI